MGALRKMVELPDFTLTAADVGIWTIAIRLGDSRPLRSRLSFRHVRLLYDLKHKLLRL